MIKNNYLKRGFTLIELLVVIAIIGILASVILVPLLDTRDQGFDAAVKSNMNSARTQAELYSLENGGRYTKGTGFANTVCGQAKFLDALETASESSLISEKFVSGDHFNKLQTFEKPFCNATALMYVVSVPMLDSAIGAGNARHWCLDSDGFAGKVSADLGVDDVKCP